MGISGDRLNIFWNKQQQRWQNCLSFTVCCFEFNLDHRVTNNYKYALYSLFSAKWKHNRNNYINISFCLNSFEKIFWHGSQPRKMADDEDMMGCFRAFV